ncbi:MAG: NAD(P)/FAD-dependent oxidoreductase [Rubrivivax sp.]
MSSDAFLPPAPLPTHCEVLVVGAGPAGSACARVLAQGGVDVVIADQSVFPRDKVCGDGLIPDAHAALARLGLLDEVMARAQSATHVGCVGPSGGRIEVPGSLAVLPRRQLDDILCLAAQAAGARFVAPARFEEALEDAAGRVCGARFKVGDAAHEIRAHWVVLATGAVPQALIAAGMCDRRTPSGIALRGYVKNDAMAGRLKALDVVWHRKLRPGYGWIFPCRDGVFNIGVGIAHSHRTLKDGRLGMKDVNLRQVFTAFTEVYAPARELMAGGTLLGELKGAPLRCTLEGARFSRPGLLVTGEAVGTTYSFTGEGIGKALETGILAAEALAADRAGAADAATRAGFEARLERLRPRFEMYEKANRVNVYPWLADLVIWRAKKSQRLLARMSGVLEETSNPGNIVSFKGLRRLFME